jgi:hypothetical protein
LITPGTSLPPHMAWVPTDVVLAEGVELTNADFLPALKVVVFPTVQPGVVLWALKVRI